MARTNFPQPVLNEAQQAEAERIYQRIRSAFDDMTGRRESVVEAQRRVTTCFRNHHHKMDYPRYVAAGWQIGSGPVESACGTVINDRLCGSGMRWGSPGSGGVCHLRALFLSEPNQWNSFWRDNPN